MVAKLVFGMNQSLDGYVDHDRFAPDPVLFRYFIEQTRSAVGCLYGRGLYELMRYWDDDVWEQDDPTQTEDLRDFAMAWRAKPKWVVSRSLTSVGPNATLIDGDLETSVRDLKVSHDGVIDLGGPNLAHSLGQLGLIDEYQIFLHPVVLGHGRPLFVDAHPPLRLAATERIGSDVIKLTYAPQ